MKTKISLILIAFFIQCYSFAQTVDKLDEKYGFKIFKFGTSPDNYVGKLKKDSASLFNRLNVTVFSYIGNDMEYLYNVKTESIDLTFYKNKLMGIQIEFDQTFSENDYNNILKNLQELFGDGFNCPTDDTDFSKATGRKWIGKKVDMEIHRLYYNKKAEWSGYICLYEKALEQQRVSDGF